MNWRAIWAIARKDLKAALQNKGVTLPIVLVPLILLVILPIAFSIILAVAAQSGTPIPAFASLLQHFPAGFKAEIASLNSLQQVVVTVLMYMLAPMFLILPLMVASVIAADSLAGEKERKTLEALLYTPTTDRELFLGKTLAAWIPAMGVVLGGFIIYALVANSAAWPIMGRIFFPNAMWLVLILWVCPAAAGLGLSVMVLVSARAQGFQDAYQLGSLVVLPVLLLLLGQLTGVMYFSVGMVILIGLLFWIIDTILLMFGVRLFQRSEILARL